MNCGCRQSGHIIVRCPLCVRTEKTPKHYEDGLVWIVDCETCGVPMAVSKTHRTPPSTQKYIVEKLKELFPDKDIDIYMKTHPEHFHAHAR